MKSPILDFLRKPDPHYWIPKWPTKWNYARRGQHTRSRLLGARALDHRTQEERDRDTLRLYDFARGAMAEARNVERVAKAQAALRHQKAHP